MVKDLTQLQIRSLPEVYNFTDGHAHRPFDDAERQIAARLSTYFLDIERERHSEIERNYMDAFYGMYGQTINLDRTKYLFLSSASLSLEVTANFVRLKGYDLALIEPCFDNLANMFKRHNVPLQPFPDYYLEETPEQFEQHLQTITAKAICIVSPNNPTGITYTPEIFQKLVEFCQREHRLLIIDSSFRAYKDPDFVFDEYKVLQESGIDYIFIEDSGKTWPTKELKVSMLAIAAQIYDEFFDIYTDFQYLHSTVVIRFLTDLVKASAADGLHTVKDVVAKNRQRLYSTLQGTFLEPQENGFTSVAWLHITDTRFTGEQLCEILKAHGIFVLPGHHFYWTGAEEGQHYIRIALAREEAKFERAMQRLSEVLHELQEKAPEQHAPAPSLAAPSV
jgi:aspartate/methionine/tyrosine aminotransferase